MSSCPNVGWQFPSNWPKRCSWTRLSQFSLLSEILVRNSRAVVQCRWWSHEISWLDFWRKQFSLLFHFWANELACSWRLTLSLMRTDVPAEAETLASLILPSPKIHYGGDIHHRPNYLIWILSRGFLVVFCVPSSPLWRLQEHLGSQCSI